ncbi:MAG: phosphatidate cytidylyltransferase [Sulfuricella sp.]|nr:phosphatidate cytidylyltransferase [Sulfuricella sp.]
MLKARVLTALLLLPAVLAALFFLPDLYWAWLMLAVTLVGAREWAAIAGYSSLQRGLYVLLTLAIGAILMSQASRSAEWSIFSAAALFWIVLAPLWLRSKWQARPQAIMALVGWLVLIPTWLALVSLRGIGPGVLLGLMTLVWIADSAAYFAGRRFGKHRLAPAISPGKTWEGVAGAFIGVTLYALAWAGWDNSAEPFRHGLPGGMLLLWLLTAFSILGDLFESWMKRVAGLKDSGRLLPGHGGVLDRIDALTAALPMAAFGLLLIKDYNAI